MQKIQWREGLAYPVGLVVASFVTPRLGIDRVVHPYHYGLVWGGMQLAIFLSIYHLPQWLSPRKPAE